VGASPKNLGMNNGVLGGAASLDVGGGCRREDLGEATIGNVPGFHIYMGS
jgi:hypothetical protein